MNGERHQSAARGWIVWCGGLLSVLVLALGLAWWFVPLWWPVWVVEHSPWPEPALRAVFHEEIDDSRAWKEVEERLPGWGPAVGPALRRAFAAGDETQRSRVISLATGLAASDGIAPGTTFAPGAGSRFQAGDVATLREDLYQLVLAAMADGSAYLPNQAAYLARALQDPRVVTAFCDYLRGRKPPVMEDLEQVLIVLGDAGDVRAVPFLIPLLPIRHRANPVVEGALARCLAPGALPAVRAATSHPHEVVRTWAVRQFARYRDDAAMVQRLVALIGDPERQVSLAAIAAAAETRLAAAGPALVRLLAEEGDPETRLAAVETIGLLAYAPARYPLRALCGLPGDPLRGAAVIALGALRDPGDFPRLLELLGDEDEDLARNARIALDQLPLNAEQRAQVGRAWRSPDDERVPAEPAAPGVPPPASPSRLSAPAFIP